MAQGKKTGGRQKGTPNETTQQTREWAAGLKKKHEVDAFVGRVMAAGEECEGACKKCGTPYYFIRIDADAIKQQGFVWKTLTEYERGKPVQPLTQIGPVDTQVTFVNHVARPKR